jgi:hypothetical protein
MRRLAFVVAALCAIGAEARADWPSWAQDGKSGRFMLDLRIGPAIPISRTAFAAAAVGIEFGVSTDAAHNFYFFISPQVHTAPIGTLLILPVGIEYDFKLPMPGLYIYPRLALGAAGLLPGAGPSHATGVFIPELGVKLVFKQRWNVGFEPFSLPIFFGQYCAGGVCASTSAVSYRLTWYGGVNF